MVQMFTYVSHVMAVYWAYQNDLSGRCNVSTTFIKDRYYLGHWDVTVLVVNEGQDIVTTKLLWRTRNRFSQVDDKNDSTGESVIHLLIHILVWIGAVYIETYYIYGDSVWTSKTLLTILLWISHYGNTVEDHSHNSLVSYVLVAIRTSQWCLCN